MTPFIGNHCEYNANHWASLSFIERKVNYFKAPKTLTL